MKTTSCVLLLLCIAAASCARHTDVHWTYAGASGPEHWGTLSPEFAACGAGQSQSPIDITRPVEADLAPIDIQYTGRTTDVLNNGHTIQVNVDRANWMVAEGEKWELVQFHFHSPSEHRVNGASFPLEVHFVHRSSAGALAALGVLFQEGAPDTRLSSIWSAMPPAANATTPFAISLQELQLIPADTTYFRYSGSLTTPPCSEGLRWFVVQDTRTASRDEIATFVKAVGENARPVQPINARVIVK